MHNPRPALISPILASQGKVQAKNLSNVGGKRKVFPFIVSSMHTLIKFYLSSCRVSNFGHQIDFDLGHIFITLLGDG
ncbi:hypothetical protein NQZ68_002121 [Dissostichus eleginoides]|nr:hypothetical protein NQZ68_002121 [Dissostichus eleginoides]